MANTRIIIVGAGFAGLFTAAEIVKKCPSNSGIEITLLDRNNYHMFVPLLYHVATGGLSVNDICFATRPMIRKWRESVNISFSQCEVTGIDFENKTVKCAGDGYPFDYLVLGLGSTTNYYGIPGAQSNVFPLKSANDATVIHNRIIDHFENTNVSENEQNLRQKLTVVVVGGGPTGVEMSATLALFLFKTLSRDFSTLMPYVRLVMVEGSGTLLNGMPARLGQLAERRLKKMGVEIVFNFRVKAATDHSIESADGRSIQSENIIWVAGIKPSPFVDNLDLAKSRDGRIIVNSYFEVAGKSGVYAIGDCAYLPQPGTDRPYSSTAQSATKMGIACGRNIACKINGHKQMKQFTYKHRNDIVFLGRNYAVGEFYGITVGNSAAFAIYVAYHLIKLTGFKSKLTTSINWFYDYFSGRNTSRI